MDGIVHTYKARLVAKGYTQLYGVDYEETFSPVADIRSIRILISVAAYYDYEIWKMDIKTAFLNGYLDEDIYMVQPEGFIDPNHLRKGVQRGARHYHRRYHYVRESIALGEIIFLTVHTDGNLADPFTKTLPKGKLTQHARSMGLYLASSFM
ncbi:retrotransposon protein, putative, ty1-copia subclass [Tanacetum coccineum]